MPKWIMLLGASIFLVGVLLAYAPWLLSWFGRLPGDIRIESESTRVFIPITSMIVVSLALSLLLHLIRRL
jgi:hypothetical protein